MPNFLINFECLLPYKRDQYIEFLAEDFEKDNFWNGISLQFKNRNNYNYGEVVDVYAMYFNQIHSIFENDINWIINHDDKDLKWFPNNSNNLNSLRNLFVDNDIERTFQGALILSGFEIRKLSRDLVSYSNVLSYKNIDISHPFIPFIIKFTSHLTIDLLSPNIELLDSILQQTDFTDWTIIEYRTNPGRLKYILE